MLWTVLLAVAMLTKLCAGQDEEFGRLPYPKMSISPPFLEDGFNAKYFNMGGDISVRRFQQGQDWAAIQLTPDKGGKHGWMCSKNTLKLTYSDFEIVTQFRIMGETAGVYGDGMAVWLTTSPDLGLSESMPYGPVFGAPDKLKGFGMVVDLYRNGRKGRAFPYAHGMIMDGIQSYDNDHDGQYNEEAYGLDGCSLKGIYNSVRHAEMRISYVRGRYLGVDFRFKSHNEWKTCTVLDGDQVQRLEEIVGDEPLYLGVSAMTGEVSAKFQIGDVAVQKLINAPEIYADLAAINGVHDGEFVWNKQKHDIEEQAEMEELEEQGGRGLDKKKHSNKKDRGDNKVHLSAKAQKKLKARTRRKLRAMKNTNQQQSGRWLTHVLRVTLFIILLLFAYIAFAAYRSYRRKQKYPRYFD
ncbi:concanavalin A-like lectin/glucanase domain-containing protein [Yarrowia lipolytica]|jgi:mannose-binding lectin 2|uniref:Concanavalin A-like lectin/glucanase domain-containing protein n=1 Tax=Yarrowia lipolytica TaxID=4952 RepID=A0A371C7L3_YARLL|nr:VIP36-like protein [Yarrowia lipolytica]RDW26279.1 concanavalin A-like lectin/glucanase domain-containing protein [Yarrowia lipolytica]RDW32371.1 concanavalin A-like lectin/glucanase domain-containing protein [Yarrowia lipolytica]RDW38308.1 concanavalin A-like lectin/glucanase domain-containing protein [Yarrowia lipolytica]RDW46096.1 concanavalin A-like lectin/glucanase domain-containing protein [Yarrowia lipolytica]